MAEFCKCGSLILAGRCSNKNCTIKLPGQDKAATAPTAKGPSKTGKTAGKTGTAAAKSSRTRRSSKCITYNINDLLKEKGDVDQ